MMRRVVLSLAFFLVTPGVWAGNFPGEQPTYSRKQGQEIKLFYGSSGGADGQVEYICKAFPGTNGSDSTASSVWQVARLTYDADANVTDVEYAGDDDAYNQICDNRSALNYD